LVDKAIGDAGDIDTAIISMKLKSGALAVIDNCRRALYGYDQRVEAFGSLGQVAIANNTESSAVISDADGVHAEKPLLFFLERYMQAYVAEITEFVDCIVNDKEIIVDVDCGLQPVLIGLAAKKSLLENRPVKIAEIAKQYNI
jgi:myo-inositol 2-dehydrogenase/D-chiro-inositol 1-dehydrogenase